MKKIFLFIASIFGVFILIGIAGFLLLMAGQGKVLDEIINDVAIENVEDGTYKGKYKRSRWTNEVEVIVKGGKIVEIKIIDDVMFPQEGLSEKIHQEIIDKQSLEEVDIVSGATLTSKAYIKSVEDALEDED